MNKTKLLVEICDMEHGIELIESQKYAIVLNVKDVSYTREFNCYTNELRLLSEKALENNVELYANLDMLYHEDDLTSLKAIIKRLHSMQFKGLIISDIGIIELVKELELDFDFINGGSILNTNYASINANSKFYDGFMISNEININEINKIVEKTDTKLIIQVYGKQKIFTSKRRLLTSYFENYNLEKINFHPKSRLIIRDQNNQDNLSYIFEDTFGTYIYTFDNVDGLDYVANFKENNVDYLFISNLFKEKKQYNEIILAYYQYLNDEISFDTIREVIDKNTRSLSKSFFEDASVYTIEQAKLLEEELKNE